MLVREEAGMIREIGQILRGKSNIRPDPRDRRFRHPVWQQNQFYKRVMQSYLAWRQSLINVVDNAAASTDDRSRAQFALSLITEALAPTNSYLGNPGAIKRIAETRGRSILHGLKNFAEDVIHNGGLPRQVDESKFQVGKNLASTPGAVVYRDAVMEVIQYKPATSRVFSRPALVVPPQINKFYVVDLAPGRSFAEYATANGVPLYTISWRNPTAAQRDWSLETYLEACKKAIEVVKDISRCDSVNVLAACAGGYTLATLLGHLAASGDTSVHSATFLVTILDTTAPTMMSMFASKNAIAAALRRSRTKGVLDGRDMNRAFAWLRPNDLIWLFVANNWVMGNDPPAFDILYWNADSTRLPAEFHADLLSIYLENPLARKNRLTVLGTPIDMSKVDIDTYVLAGITDHITPWQACYETHNVLSGSRCQFVLSSSGHIQSIVNPPSNPKAKYYLNAGLDGDADEWLAGATGHAGSWWDHWLDWYGQHGGKKRAAPKTLGSKTYPAGDLAPGRYVHQR